MSTTLGSNLMRPRGRFGLFSRFVAGSPNARLSGIDQGTDILRSRSVILAWLGLINGATEKGVCLRQQFSIHLKTLSNFPKFYRTLIGEFSLAGAFVVK
jgi:hypothetical protein